MRPAVPVRLSRRCAGQTGPASRGRRQHSSRDHTLHGTDYAHSAEDKDWYATRNIRFVIIFVDKMRCGTNRLVRL